MSIRQGSKIIAGMPDVSGKADKATTYTKDEVDNLIQNIDALPNQADNSGKFLTTDGTQASWSELPDITMNGWNIFDHKFSDHLLNDPSWVRSDTYSWQDGGIYFTAYEELEKEFNSNTELSTDTYEDINVSYYKSVNGLKICLPDQSDAIEQLYANTGVAWYYIIDTENKRFKLPRKVSETLDLNTIAVVGNGMTLGFTDGSQFAGLSSNSDQLGYFSPSNYGKPVGSSQETSTFRDRATIGITTDPEKSGIIADLSTIGYKEVTEQTYLYFFMGDTLRDARIIDVNAVVENQTNVTNELDALKNLLATIDYVVESKVATDEDSTWYRLYKSGWIEQGGYEDNPNESQPLTVNLLKPFVSTNYSITLGNSNIGFSATQSRIVKILSKTTDTITFTGPYDNAANGDFKFYWEAKGQGA